MSNFLYFAAYLVGKGMILSLVAASNFILFENPTIWKSHLFTVPGAYT